MPASAWGHAALRSQRKGEQDFRDAHREKRPHCRGNQAAGSPGKRYREAARAQFQRRAAYYHRFTGGHYTSVAVRDQKTRWGSCSSRGTLSFNYRLIFAPPVILDYVVVHELCHLTHMNHSKDFWDMVAQIMPEHRQYRRWLRDHGHELTLTAYLERMGIPVTLD